MLRSTINLKNFLGRQKTRKNNLQNYLMSRNSASIQKPHQANKEIAM